MNVADQRRSDRHDPPRPEDGPKKPANAGDWVRIHRTALQPDQRAPNLPADTRSTPFQVWTNGFLESPTAEIGDEVRIRTLIGRRLIGDLVVINPRYDHDFGEPQPELLAAADEVRSLIERR